MSGASQFGIKSRTGKSEQSSFAGAATNNE